jgi:hypothetical protein
MDLGTINKQVEDNFIVWTEKIRQKMVILENLWDQSPEQLAGMDLDTFLDRRRADFDLLKDTDDMIEAPITGFDIPVIDPRCPPDVQTMRDVAQSFRDLLVDAESYLQWLTAQ